MGRPGALKRQAKAATGVAAAVAFRAAHVAHSTVELCEEHIATCERIWHEPWKVEGWQDATMFSADDKDDFIHRRLMNTCEKLDRFMLIKRHDIKQVTNILNF